MPEMLSNYTVLSLVSMVKMFFLKEDHRKNRLAAMFFVLHKDEDEKKKQVRTNKTTFQNTSPWKLKRKPFMAVHHCSQAESKFSEQCFAY